MDNKASYLLKLRKAGFNVPNFLILSVKPKNEEEILDELKVSFSNVEYFAVRSSADCEDSKEKSFAGFFYSAIGVKKANLYQEVLKVIDSYDGKEGDVIIQDFIPSDKAGVIFSDAGNGTMVVNSNFGLCSTVVEGRKCDEYIVNREEKIISKTIEPDKQVFLFVNGSITVKEDESSESLSEGDIKKIFKLARSIEALMGCPQDIEWCFLKETLYVLQSRPITKNLFDKKSICYFDSANIAESYSGIVLPLTCSFASHVYSEVYKGLVIASGVSRKKVDKHLDVFDNMLGFFYGRMYYNMNNWYKMIAFLPGYKKNKENFEQMITSNISEDIDRDIFPSAWLTAGYPFLLLGKIILFPLVISRFKKMVRSKIRSSRGIKIEELSLKECKELYSELDRKLLGNWYRAVENDFLVMTFFGLFKKIYPEEIIKGAIKFNSEGAKQVNALKDLSTRIRGNDELWQALKLKNESQFKEKLSHDFSVEKNIDDYFLKYGGRFANELKLESKDIESNFEKFAEVIESYFQNDINQPNQRKYKFSGNFFKKIYGQIILGEFKKYSIQREGLRLLRSNVFAIVRKILFRMGSIYYQEELIEKREDIFYLTVEEIFSSTKLRSDQLLSIVKSRKEEYLQYEKINLSSHFSVESGKMPVFTDVHNKTSKLLQARPCTPGKVRGVVRVFKEFSMPKKIDFDIIVASRTDPGWTALIGVSRGMIIEHGGVLSHAAIVSRELGIPTVIGAANATEILKNNQVVEIDGSTGRVDVVKI